MEFEVVTLEDNNKYAIAKEKNNYLLLINVNDEEDFCIRKNVIKDGKNLVVTLDSEDEFNEAVKILIDEN